MYSEAPSPHYSPSPAQAYHYPTPIRMLNQATWSSDSLPLRRYGNYSSSTSNAGSVASNDSIAIDLTLNPIQDQSLNKQPRVTLPSITTLDFYRYDLPPIDQLDIPPHSASYYYARPPTPRVEYPPFQSSLSPRDRHRFKRIKSPRSAHSFSASGPDSPPSSPGSTTCQYTPLHTKITSCHMDPQEQARHRAAYARSQQLNHQHNYEKQQKSLYPQSQAQQGHSNKKYTTEEMHFIQYFREDKRMQWADIVGPFNAQFPAHKRERGALECRYYRFQMYPKVNDDGSFQYDDKGEIVMVNTKVRDRRDKERSGGEKWRVLNDYFKLVSRCPEQVLEYEWTDEEDKRRARGILSEREKTGRTHLPGALLRSRSSL